MHARKLEDTTTSGEAHPRGSLSALWSVSNMKTAQAGSGEASSVSARDGRSKRRNGIATGCLICRYRSPVAGKDGTNA